MGEFSTRIRAISILKRANRLRDAGQLSEAWECVCAGRLLLESLRTTRTSSLDLARTSQLAAEIQLGLGNLEAALDWYARAEESFERADSTANDFGLCLYNMAIVFRDINLPNLGIEYAERAKSILAKRGNVAFLRETESLIEEMQGEYRTDRASAQRKLDQIRSDVARAGSKQARILLIHRLSVEILSAGLGRTCLEELHLALWSAYTYTAEKGDLVNSILVLKAFIDMIDDDVPLPPWAEQSVRRTLDEAYRRQDLEAMADSHLLLATTLYVQSRLGEALTEALRSLALHDEHILTTESSILRALTSRVGAAARQLAIRIAIEVQDMHLGAELIESARLQVQPSIGATKRASYEGQSMGGQLRNLGAARVGQLRPIAVGGRSRMADYYRPGVAGEPITFEEIIKAVGGEAAVWWGVWATSERVFWALRIHDHWYCGILDASEGTALRAIYDESLDNSMHNGEATSLDVLRGIWCRTATAEETLSVELGELVIPALLRDVLEQAASSHEPVSLVISGNLFALVPAPLLAWHGPSRRKPRRLIEDAILRVAPPAVFIARAASSAQPEADVYPLRLAVVDPTADLRWSRDIPIGAQRVLSGQAEAGLPLATREALIHELHHWPAGSPGIFYYSGHVTAEVRGSVDDALALSDGLLSAADLFCLSADGQPRVPMPSRAILSACESAAAGGTGAGEWLGLTAAILWAGSRQVVATNWSVWDTKFTARFDAELAHRLQYEKDVAVALRRLQLGYLAEWRKSDHDFTRYDRLGITEEIIRMPFPIIWAAYACVGLRQ